MTTGKLAAWGLRLRALRRFGATSLIIGLSRP